MRNEIERLTMLKKTLYLDYDGVLHPFDENADSLQRQSEDTEANLFCWAPILEAILDDIDPVGEIAIVLSTTWAQRTHWTLARNHLPNSLRSRVIGGTHPAPVARGIQIELHAMDFGISDTDWIAIDDDDYNWPTQHVERLIKCSPHIGLSCKKTQQELLKKLEVLLK